SASALATARHQVPFLPLPPAQSKRSHQPSGQPSVSGELEITLARQRPLRASPIDTHRTLPVADREVQLLVLEVRPHLEGEVRLRHRHAPCNGVANTGRV